MRTLEQILKEGIKDTDWTYCKAEYAPHYEWCKVGMPKEFTPDGTKKKDVKTCYIVTSKFRDGEVNTYADWMYLDDGNFYWYDNLWDDDDKVEQEKEGKFAEPIAWIAYENVPEVSWTFPIAPHIKDAVPTPPDKDTTLEFEFNLD